MVAIWQHENILQYLHLNIFLCNCLFLSIFVQADFQKPVLSKSILNRLVRAKFIQHRVHIQWNSEPLILPQTEKPDFSVVSHIKPYTPDAQLIGEFSCSLAAVLAYKAKVTQKMSQVEFHYLCHYNIVCWRFALLPHGGGASIMLIGMTLNMLHLWLN